VRSADVFVTNTRSIRGAARIRWEDLAPLNTRLIYASITAYGGGRGGATQRLRSTALWARTG